MAVRLLPGDGPTSVLLMQGLLGLGTIGLVYAIGWRLGGRLVAAVSGGALAFSATFLAYRRSMLPEMDSAFFFALAVLALVSWSGRMRLAGFRALGIGALTGLCFTANDRWYVALPVVLFMVLAVEARRGVWHHEVLRTLRLLLAVSAGFAIPVLLFEAVSTSFLWIAHDGGVELPYQTYFQQLYGRYRLVVDIHRGSPDLSNIPDSPYPGYLAAFDGVVWLVVAVVAALFLVVRWRRAHAVPLLWTFGPLLLASASTLTAPRYMSFAIPGIALTIGLAGGAGGGARSAWLRTLSLAAVSAALLSSAVNSPQIFRIRAGWDEALAVAREAGGTIISPKSYPVAAHAGINRVVLGFKESLQWAREREKQGARWLLLELWTPPGTPLRAVAGRKGSHTVLGPVGELSTHALGRGRPVVVRRFAPHGFVYEGFPPDFDRLIVLYDLRSLGL
jgi:4-amino-4-deoxy-L-arabinose transferase-like glycosyltransferase